MTKYANVPNPDDFWNGTFVQRVKIEGDWNTFVATGCDDLVKRLSDDVKFAANEGTTFENESIVVFTEHDAQPFVVNKVFRGSAKDNGCATAQYDLVIGPCIFHSFYTTSDLSA